MTHCKPSKHDGSFGTSRAWLVSCRKRLITKIYDPPLSKHGLKAWIKWHSLWYTMCERVHTQTHTDIYNLFMYTHTHKLMYVCMFVSFISCAKIVYFDLMLTNVLLSAAVTGLLDRWFYENTLPSFHFHFSFHHSISLSSHPHLGCKATFRQVVWSDPDLFLHPYFILEAFLFFPDVPDNFLRI